MMTLNIDGKDYEVKFGYNNFCDSDLLEQVEDMMRLISGAETDADVSAMGKMKELFLVTREVLFEGFKKKNPVDTVQDVGDLLDKYMEETPQAAEGEEVKSRGVLELFLEVTNELMSEGFLADLMAKMTETVEKANKSNIAKIPTDHKKKTTKK